MNRSIQCMQSDQQVLLPGVQTQETPLHYCARSGNADIMMEIVKHIGPSKTQYTVNRQDKVSGAIHILYGGNHNVINISPQRYGGKGTQWGHEKINIE